MRAAKVCRTPIIVALLALGSPSAPGQASRPGGPPPPLQIECDLRLQAGSYAGICSVPCAVNALAINFDGVDEKRACASPSREITASLAKTSTPGRWLGAMQGVQPEDPTRLELVPDKAGGGSVARTPFGWFRVTEDRLTPESLRVVADASRQVRPTADDLAIIDRAIALIPSADLWNKNDNRVCPTGAPKLSLFCALMQATTEISGGVHYRQPAMQAAREELNLVDKSRIKTHRIMDYNNHPDTTLQEIHSLLLRARARVAKEIR